MMHKKQDIKEEIKFFNFNHNVTLSTGDEVFDLISQELSLLDLKGLGLEGGCGTAILGQRLLEVNQNISLVGIDINKKFIRNLNQMKLPRYKAIYGNLEDRTLFKEHDFDFVILPYVLHHIPTTQTVIENVHFWLKDKGVLIILEPNGLNPILNLSYKLRNFLQKFFYSWVSRYASPNEKIISSGVLNKLFDDLFTMLVVRSFLLNFKSNNDKHFDPVFKLLAELRGILLQLYGRLHLTGQWGSDVLIIAQKFTPHR